MSCCLSSSYRRASRLHWEDKIIFVRVLFEITTVRSHCPIEVAATFLYQPADRSGIWFLYQYFSDHKTNLTWKYLPTIFSFYKGGFGHGMVSDDFRIIPLGTDFYDCNALVFYSITNIELRADVDGRPSFVIGLKNDDPSLKNWLANLPISRIGQPSTKCTSYFENFTKLIKWQEAKIMTLAGGWELPRPENCPGLQAGQYSIRE